MNTTNSWIFTEKVPTPGIPAGAYTGVFNPIEPVPPNEEKGYGPGYLFSWTIDTEGLYKGQKAPRIISVPKGAPSPKNGLGKMLVALKGGPAAEGENLDPAQWVGKRSTLIVAAGPNGGTRVETVAPIV